MFGFKKQGEDSLMSSENIITIKGVEKKYNIYTTPQARLREFIFPKLEALFGLKQRSYSQEFWALKDISFNVKRGETLGIIGRNGSGKSTLLQIICGTLSPTHGEVCVAGRVAALLELGSGFNPEFTGKENVYLNAAVLGLSSDEINARYSSIVDFADIGDFIDQPVKTYSSGMMVRLAFAVIAHVDADILVIDEALAVGDAVFTQKCMRFIRKFQEHGSLLFVSHDIASVQNLCESAIWLHEGKIALADSAKKVAEAYLQYTFQEIAGEELKLIPLNPKVNSGSYVDDVNIQGDVALVEYSAEASSLNNLSSASGWKTGGAEIFEVTLIDVKTNSSAVYKGGELLRLVIRAKANQPLENPILGFLFRDRLGQDLFGENTLAFTKMKNVSFGADMMFMATFEFTLPMLPNGQYVVMASVADGNYQENIQHHWMHDALVVNVFSSKVRYGLVGIPFSRVEMEACE
jgi:lipopolysaccharide transport system ATP-binding protein